MPEHEILSEERAAAAPENGVHVNGTGAKGVGANGVEIKPCADEHIKRNGAAPTPEVEPNYQYWRENGGAWADGYDFRKKRQVLYHIQELMLTQYIHEHA